MAELGLLFGITLAYFVVQTVSISWMNLFFFMGSITCYPESLDSSQYAYTPVSSY